MLTKSTTVPTDSRRSLAWTGGMVLLSAGLIGALFWRHADCVRRVNAAGIELQEKNAELAVTLATLEEAKRVEPAFKAFANRVESIIKERDAPSWTPAFRRIVGTVAPGIELREVRARTESEDTRTWSIRIGGISTGPEPRTIADHYRQTLQSELERAFPCMVKTRLERLDDIDEPDSISAGSMGRQAVFAIVATIEWSENAGVNGMEGA